MPNKSGVNLSLRQEILQHMVKAVEETTALDDPFPHFQITGIFPGNVYDRLLKCFPNPALFEAFDYDKFSSNGESNRKRFQLLNESLDRLTPADRGLWATIRSCLGSVAFKEAVFGKLCGGLSYRYGCKPDDARNLSGFALPEVFHETKGYEIKPHPDTRKKVVTMQIALPDDSSKASMGTEFYRRNLRPSAWMRQPKGFDIIKTMPFVPNACYAFVVLNTVRLKSWHGRTSLDGKGGVRNSILNIWYEKAEKGNLEIVRENEALAQLSKAA